MTHPLTMFAWGCVGGTTVLAAIRAFNNAEPEVQLACEQTDTDESGPFTRFYECVDAQTGEVVLLACNSVSAGKHSASLPKKMKLRAIPFNCSERGEGD
jgi:hypothetical protein